MIKAPRQTTDMFHLLASTRWLLLPLLFVLTAICFAADEEPIRAECPELPNLLKADVTAQWSYDNKSGLYVYRYTVKNSSKSRQDIRLLALKSGLQDVNIDPLPGWHGSFMERTDFAVWLPVLFDVTNRGRSSYPRTSNQIKVGKSASGFTMRSPLPPSLIEFRLLGWEQTPVTNVAPFERLVGLVGSDDASEFWQEAIMGQCPSATKPWLEVGIKGVVVGPSPNLVVQVAKLPDSISKELLPQKSPLSNNLFILFGSKEVDVRKLRQDTLKIAGTPMEIIPDPSGRIHNNDLYPDLVMQWTSLKHEGCGVTETLLSGQLQDGPGIVAEVKVDTPMCIHEPATFEVRP